ncbi:MAG: M23 family metallopeptidase [Crocinitomicaceae bacterium]
MRLLIILGLLLYFPNLFSQTVCNKVLDTIPTEDGTMIIYANRTWEYLEDLDFDGVLNEDLYQTIATDTNYQFKHCWNSDQTFVFSGENDLENMKDTLWLCVTDSNYNKFAIPFDGMITSTFKWRKGRYHKGIDIDLQTGDTVVAAFSGKVRYAQYNDHGFGNVVIIRHYNGLETAYAHLDKISVVPNQLVQAGEMIGKGGNTGKSTGSHLHFEVRFFDCALDPEEIFDFKNKKLKEENLFVHKHLFNYKAISQSKTSYASSSSTPTSYDKNARTHKIRSGDSLYKLSLMYGVSVSELCRINKIKENSILSLGQVIILR